MRFREVLTRCGLPEPKSNRGYDPIVMIESFMVCVWIGGVRFAHTQMVRFDEALRQIFGWKEVASVSTFTRFFRRFKRQTVDDVFNFVNRWFWDQIPSKTLTIDLDSSVMTRYGEQEGTAKGYNPHKKGRRSHHPLFAFVADLRMVLHAWLRPGNTATCNGVVEFFQEAIDVLGQMHRIGLVRADSGFFLGEFMKLLESKVFHYIIAVRMNSVIRSQMTGLGNWIHVDEGISVTEMKYHAHLWDKERRIIVVRQDENERPDARGKLLLEVPGYRYQAYVTEAAFRTTFLAYNLMSLFRQALLRAPKAVRLSTMRFQCFALGSWVGRKARKKILRINLSWKRRAWFEGLFARIQEFQTPWPVPT